MPVKSLTIRQSYFLNAPPRRVFRALTDPAELATWFLAHAILPHQKGAEYEFEWQGGYRHRARVLAFEADRRLSLEWLNKVGRSSLRTAVTFTVRKAGRGTQLTLRHTGYPRTGPWLEAYGDTQSGWAYFLLNLKSVLEHRQDLRSPKDT
jgi:uncharacterized protein YndB with AHSA1/START domain